MDAADAADDDVDAAVFDALRGFPLELLARLRGMMSLAVVSMVVVVGAEESFVAPLGSCVEISRMTGR